MLALTRRIGEKVIIGENVVTMTVLQIRGNQVKLGFDADSSINIHREEIYNRIQETLAKDVNSI